MLRFVYVILNIKFNNGKVVLRSWISKFADWRNENWSSVNKKNINIIRECERKSRYFVSSFAITALGSSR